MRGGLSEENVKPVSPVTPTSPKRKGSGSSTSSPLPFSHPTVHLSSLRISETSLFGSVSQQQPPETSTGTPLEDYDEVFLQNPAPPPPPFSPPIRETNITEDFPPPPPPVELEQETKEETVGRFVLQYLCVLFEMSLLLFWFLKMIFFFHLFSHFSNFSSTSEFSTISTRKSFPQSLPVSSSSVPSQLPSLEPSTITPTTTSATTEDNLSLEYQPLPKREKTSEELRVEALAQQLVSVWSQPVSCWRVSRLCVWRNHQIFWGLADREQGKSTSRVPVFY